MEYIPYFLVYRMLIKFLPGIFHILVFHYKFKKDSATLKEKLSTFQRLAK